MEWFAQMLMAATEGCTEPVAWTVCVVTGAVIITLLKGVVGIFKG
jgi:hypothetical protein